MHLTSLCARGFWAVLETGLEGGAGDHEGADGKANRPLVEWHGVKGNEAKDGGGEGQRHEDEVFEVGSGVVAAARDDRDRLAVDAVVVFGGFRRRTEEIGRPPGGALDEEKNAIVDDAEFHQAANARDKTGRGEGHGYEICRGFGNGFAPGIETDAIKGEEVEQGGCLMVKKKDDLGCDGNRQHNGIWVADGGRIGIGDTESSQPLC